MRLYVFSLYRVLILYIVDKCEFYGLGPYLSDQVNSSTWFCPEVISQCRGCRTAGGCRAETKHKRNVKGHILYGRSCNSFLDLLMT